MMDNSLFNSVQIKSFDASDAAFRNGSKLIRHHYTSPGTLIKILQGEGKTAALRFTDARYMNDRSELVVVAKVLWEYLDEHKDSFPTARKVAEALLLERHNKSDYLNLKINSIEFAEIENLPFEKTRHFVFCMSNEKDSLHMWNYYTKGGNYQGYSIGFDVYKFMKSFDSKKDMQADVFRIQYGGVLYNKQKQTKAIGKILEELESLKFDNISYQMLHLRSRMEMIAPFLKDESFKDENEYRVVFSVGEHIVKRSEEESKQYRANYYNENLKRISFDYFDRNGVLVPYMNIPVVKEAIKSVIIAPMVEAKIAKESLEEFLIKNGYKNVEVIPSIVPIRF